MKYYHGTNKQFKEFDGSYSNYNGKIYVSPCRMMAMSYAGLKGYVYEVEIDESDLANAVEKSECGCMAFIDTSKLKIVVCEPVINKMPMWQSECGKIVVRTHK